MEQLVTPPWNSQASKPVHIHPHYIRFLKTKKNQDEEEINERQQEKQKKCCGCFQLKWGKQKREKWGWGRETDYNSAGCRNRLDDRGGENRTAKTNSLVSCFLPIFFFNETTVNVSEWKFQPFSLFFPNEFKFNPVFRLCLDSFQYFIDE